MNSPWVVYGQTQLNQGQGLDNPVPNVNGLFGEVTSLPYTVPEGYTLQLETWGAESYKQPGTVVIFPWLGEGPATNQQCLPSAGASGGTRQLTGTFQIPAGKIVNFRLENGEGAGVYAWFACGCLIPVT